MFRLTPDQTRSLLNQPESGMGYQVVDAVTMDDTRKRGLVLNAELLSLDEDRRADQIALFRKSVTEALRDAPSAADAFRSVSVVKDRRTTVLLKSGAEGASGASAETTRDDERFYRFSAFSNDRRVAPDNSLMAGTYATTEEDGNKVTTGKQAVERYALPNNDPASYRYLIRPHKATLIQKGIVQPANGHPGGGVEVIFTAGTQKDTVALPPAKIPDA